MIGLVFFLLFIPTLANAAERPSGLCLWHGDRGRRRPGAL